MAHAVLDQRPFSILAAAQNLPMLTGCRETVLTDSQCTPPWKSLGEAEYTSMNILSYVQPPKKGYIQKIHRLHGD